ncbi:MAG TPA: BamA/TamA family outer membrane protein [Gemmatimonadaceae bacterium]|nr:BamA/TamA family outer membrane protein [Gemmatimonadaceae bacterium]
MARQRWRTGLVAFLVSLVLAAPRIAGAQLLACQSGDAEVRKLDFQGNHAFSDDHLSQIVATTTSSLTRRIFRRWVGQERCLDRDELARDIARVKLYYRQRGYWEAQVDTIVTQRGKRAVGVTFTVVEGEPIRLTTLRITGLDSVVNRRAILGGLDTTAHGPYDEIRLVALADSIGSRLLDNGYPGARISVGHDVATDARTAAYYIDVDPGHLARIAEVRVVVDSTRGGQKIRARTVKKILGLRPGAVYRRKDLIRAQRNLYATDAYRHVELGLAPGQSGEDSLLVVQASLIEGDMRSMQTGVGWGTLDCFRTQAVYGDRNFLGGARRIDVTARLSKLGVADPAKSESIRHSICQPAGRDSIGTRTVNYYAGATYRQPTFFGLRARSVPSFTLYSERRSEFKQYERTTPIGLLASVTREQWNRAPLTFGYQIERGRTRAAPAFFCALFQICDEALRTRIADSTLRLAVASAALTIDRTDVPLSPTTGGILRLELRHASRFVGSSASLQFNKGIADGSWFAPLGTSSVLALRLRVGAVTPLKPTLRQFDLAKNFVPPQERLYAGGTNTVRGVQQNELGPLVYIADRRYVYVESVDSTTRIFQAIAPNGVPIQSKGFNFVPTGGTRLIVANAEVRFRDPFFPNLLQWTAFTDAGNVWEAGNRVIARQSLRITPGLGLSVLTFLGPIGVTAGYNDKQQPAGPLYYNDLYAANNESPNAPNVSNLTVCLPTTGVATVRRVNGVWQQDRSECSSSGFRPDKRRALSDRIVLLFSIGQAF